MIGKVQVTSYSAVSSKLVHRRCPRCKQKAKAALVDYGKGGKLLFCACGDVREAKK